MSTPEITAIVSLLVSILALGVMVTKNRYDASKGKTEDQVENEHRLTSLETKVGLFWHLVEQNLGDALAKANPIHLTMDEQAAAQVYKHRKDLSPTSTLKILDAAIEREIRQDYMDHDEKMIFTLIQGAIKSQLLDRGQL